MQDREEQIKAIRRFSRFYTRQIGVLQEGILRSPLSLTEARVIYELAQGSETTATELANLLSLDGGYLSRVVRSLDQEGLVRRTQSPDDGRQQLLALTPEGREAFAQIDRESARDIANMLSPLSDSERRTLVQAMAEIERLLGGSTDAAPYMLRPHQSGDMGWVVERHGILYNKEYGWDQRFEALVARITADFVDNYDPARERCWIAEKDGERVGSVFLVKHPERPATARLRLLLVQPQARGLGIGRRLVHECTRFALQAGYDSITLWTNSCLDAARRLYELEGYELVDEESHSSFGAALVGQTWELDLAKAASHPR